MKLCSETRITVLFGFLSFRIVRIRNSVFLLTRMINKMSAP